MKREVTDERLQDYLDGRLADDDRAEIEALLRDDAELSRRVEAWRAVGRALRGDPAELPPGFHARARERFEQAMGSRVPWGFRLLSWEVAGLAAAVVLAAALFIPELMRDPDLGRVLRPAAPGETGEARRDAPVPDAPVQRWKEQDQQRPGKDAAPDDATAIVDDPAPPPPGPVADKRAPATAGRRERAAPAAEPLEQKAAAPELEEELPLAGERYAPAPTPAPGRGALEGVPSAEPVRNGEQHGEQRRLVEDELRSIDSAKKAKGYARTAGATEAYAGVERSEADSPSIVEPFVVDLPADLSIVDGMRVIDERAAWEGELAGPAGSALVRLGGYDARRRLVVIGRSGGVDCSALRVLRDELGYRVWLAAAGASPGCAFLLPRDGLAVSLERGE